MGCCFPKGKKDDTLDSLDMTKSTDETKKMLDDKKKEPSSPNSKRKTKKPKGTAEINPFGHYRKYNFSHNKQQS